MKNVVINLLMVGCVAVLCQCKTQNESSTPEKESTDWSSFDYPEVDFTNEDSLAKGAPYATYIPDPEQMIQETALRVCQQLYRSPNEVPNVEQVVYRIHDYDGISGKGGEPPIINVSFSSDYLDKQINAGISKEKIVDEIVGVLVHEMTHAYQQSCKYEGEGWSVIEGIADAVRYLEGYIDDSLRKSGGHWNDGYKTTGFFIAWVQQNKQKDFLYQLNQSVGKDFDWQWEPAISQITGSTIAELWAEYQAYLKDAEG